jgi:hypothetical protein
MAKLKIEKGRDIELLHALRVRDSETTLSRVSDSLTKCESCESTIAVLLFSIEEMEFSLCRVCAIEASNKALFILNSAEMSEQLSTQITGEPFDLEGFSIENPAFSRTLNDFRSGLFTLDNGDQDPILESIASQVLDKGNNPSEKQITFFSNRTVWYTQRRLGGQPLVLPDSLRKEEANVRPLLDEVLDEDSSLSDKDRVMVKSFSEFCSNRGYLTEKQHAILVRIHDTITYT